MSNILSLFQLCDSTFPNGSFSQSFGLETYIQKDMVHDSESFLNWLRAYVNEQLSYSDGLAVKIIYEALEENQNKKIWEIDRLLRVQNLARESREGTQRMGESMLNIAEVIYGFEYLKTYKRRIKNKESFGHPAVVFAIAGYQLGVEKEQTILYYLYSTMIGIVQNAVRAIPLGQTTGQSIIHDFQKDLKKAIEKIMNLDESEFGVVSPGLELSQMQHERVRIRIFSS